MKHSLITILAALTAAALHAADTGFTIEKNDHGISVSVGGKAFASYVIDQANKPYLWPIYGPTGKAMTRAYPMQDVSSEPKEQRDHPHHRGITFGHESIGGGTWKFPDTNEEWSAITGDEKHSGGGDTWHERMTFEEFMQNPKLALRGKQRLPMVASIRHREFTEAKADAEKATIVELCDYLDPGGKRFLTEERRLTFRVISEIRAIDVDQTFTATDGEVRFADRKDAGLSIRIPSSMAVDSKQGGQIINSDGFTDKDAWGKPAKWCDYHGPVEGEHLGIAFLNHPASYRYPTRWHVRTYGLFTANPFAQHDYDPTLPDGTTTLKSGEHLKLHHRFIFHTGDAANARIEAAWQQYAKETK
jgi:hypothetical protein